MKKIVKVDVYWKDSAPGTLLEANQKWTHWAQVMTSVVVFNSMMS